MSFDLAIRIGDILQVVTISAGGLAVFVQMRADMKNINARLDKNDEELAKQTLILSQLAAGEERMNGLERRLELIENRR